MIDGSWGGVIEAQSGGVVEVGDDVREEVGSFGLVVFAGVVALAGENGDELGAGLEEAGFVRYVDGTIMVMTKGGRGSAGGRANETGSVYRSSFGAYLIAYGLADHHVSLDAVSPGVPEWLWFESDAPVDDIAVQFSSGARWDIQATARCDWGTKFRKTIAQWVRAARSGRLKPNDRIGLAAANLSQPLLDLRDAFRRVRDGGTFAPREEAAISKLRTDAQTDGWLDVFDQVTRTAVIVHLDCATELDPGFRADLDAAWKLLDRNLMTIDTEGEVTGVEEAIEALVEAHPFIIGPANSDEPTTKDDNPFRATSSGSPMAGKHRPRSEPSATTLAKKYPALRR